MKYIFLILLIPFVSQASYDGHDVEELRFRESVILTQLISIICLYQM
ncbi:hypothetical protein FNJ87_16990 [Nonlabens mediterrranea]|uniref:Uncharacterized protein n=1 Tax=Nonlabens mediterrranea TaxID=1419947 RepID=A0ABS0A975_9FLAO|nr:hypothetical protein [Nonlabens mediterrranea]